MKIFIILIAIAAIVIKLLRNKTKAEEAAEIDETLHPLRMDTPSYVQKASSQAQKPAVQKKPTQPPIVERAKQNTSAYVPDVTLETLEAEHQHSERVAPAVHVDLEHDIDLGESMLGSVEDLMAKGYDGNLCFDRDFVGEGLDMISRFVPPTEIPDYTLPEQKIL